MYGVAAGALVVGMRHIANEIAGLPGIRLLAKPLYRHRFHRPQKKDEVVHYYGRYDSFAQAKAHTPQTQPLDHHYLDRLRVTDYPVLYWLSRLLPEIGCRLFDLGGNMGTSYYAYRPYLDYPADMRWLVHDMPTVLAAGRDWALEHDPEHQLAFTDSPDDADGCELLISSGTLQYLDYTLAELLQRIHRPPLHVLVNRVPMHPSHGYFTLQKFGIGICPYRVAAVSDFIASMEGLGYSMIDHWKSQRSLHVPFEPSCAIDSYHGFYFKRN